MFTSTSNHGISCGTFDGFALCDPSDDVPAKPLLAVGPDDGDGEDDEGITEKKKLRAVEVRKRSKSSGAYEAGSGDRKIRRKETKKGGATSVVAPYVRFALS